MKQRKRRERPQKSFVTLTGRPASAAMAEHGIVSPSPQIRALLHSLVTTVREDRKAEQLGALRELLLGEADAEGWKAVVLPSDTEVRDFVRCTLAAKGIDMFDAEEYTETVTVNTPKGMPSGTVAVQWLRLRKLHKATEP